MARAFIPLYLLTGSSEVRFRSLMYFGTNTCDRFHREFLLFSLWLPKALILE